MSDLVSLNYVEEYNISTLEAVVKNAIAALGTNKLHAKMKVMLKVCVPYSFAPDQAKTTHPAVVSAVANVLSAMGIEVVVAESPYGAFSLEELDKVYVNSGMLEVENTSKCKLNHNLKTFDLEIANGVATKSCKLLDVVNDVDAIINISKLKLDAKFGYFGATANLFGLIPGEMKTVLTNRLKTLKNFNNFIIDMAEALKNKLVLNIVDGIVALEANDMQHMMYCLALSENAYKLDACMLNILGVNLKNTFLKQAAERGLINLDRPFKVLGEAIDKFKADDFALTEFNEESLLYESNFKQKHYFNTYQQRVNIKQKNCKGCKICSKICPTGAIMMRYDKNNELYAKIDYDKCVYCFKCFEACPYRVVEVITPLGYKLIEKQISKFNEEGK